MGTIKNLNKISSIYLVISAIISLFFITVIIFQYEITGIFWFTMPLCILVVVVSILNNYNILVQPLQINKLNLLINMCVSFLQMPLITVNGFQFKYNQGLQLIAYLKLSRESKEAKVGIYFENFNHLLNVKFLEINYSIIGIDLVTLFLFLFYLYQFKLKNTEGSIQS